jgi:hypothetical protein
VSPVRDELRFYIPEDGILHSHHREYLKSYIEFNGWALEGRRKGFLVRYELGFFIAEGGILHSHRRENLKCYRGCIYLDILILVNFPLQHWA